jgi:hypothetical protein
MVVCCFVLESSCLQVSVLRNTSFHIWNQFFQWMLVMYLKSQHYHRISHTVAVQITTTLYCLTSSIAEHKPRPGNITCWPYTVTLAVDRLTYLAWLFVDNSLSLSTMIIKFLITKLVPIMNCTEGYHYRASIVIPVLSLVWSAGGPETKCFPNPDFPASGPIPLSQNRCLPRVLWSNVQIRLAVGISGTKAATNPQLGWPNFATNRPWTLQYHLTRKVLRRWGLYLPVRHFKLHPMRQYTFRSNSDYCTINTAKDILPTNCRTYLWSDPEPRIHFTTL